MNKKYAIEKVAVEVCIFSMAFLIVMAAMLFVAILVRPQPLVVWIGAPACLTSGIVGLAGFLKIYRGLRPPNDRAGSS